MQIAGWGKGTVGLAALAIMSLTGCNRAPEHGDVGRQTTAQTSSPEAPATLTDARRGFSTKLIKKSARGEPAPEPPPALFRRVWFPSPVGDLVAYVTPPPGDGKRHPAIVWVQGGFDPGVDESAWRPAPRSNDQSAGAFRQAGVVLMHASRRGGNDNPGSFEGFYGEVDDVIAAADYLAKLDYVDPARIYLGGHSTGGTVALLAAESTDRFRAVFAFGPVAFIERYADELPFDTSDPREMRLRSPILYMQTIRSPTLIIEGGTPPSNADQLPAMQKAARGAPVQTYAVPGASHFSVLGPVTRLLAAKVAADKGAMASIALSEEELAAVARGE